MAPVRKNFLLASAMAYSVGQLAFALKVQPGKPDGSSALSAPLSEDMIRIDSKGRTGSRRSSFGLRGSDPQPLLDNEEPVGVSSSSGPKVEGDYVTGKGALVLSPVMTADQETDPRRDHSSCDYKAMKDDESGKRMSCSTSCVPDNCKPGFEGKESKRGTDCIICYDEPMLVKFTNCGCYIGENCARELVKRHPDERRCPMCRTKITKAVDPDTGKIIAVNDELVDEDGDESSGSSHRTFKKWTEEGCGAVCHVGSLCVAASTCCLPCTAAACVTMVVGMLGNTMEGQDEAFCNRIGLQHNDRQATEQKYWSTMDSAYQKCPRCFDVGACLFNTIAGVTVAPIGCCALGTWAAGTCCGNCNEDHVPERICCRVTCKPACCALGSACAAGTYCGSGCFVGHCCCSGCLSVDAKPCSVLPTSDCYRLYKRAQLQQGERPIEEEVYKDRPDMTVCKTGGIIVNECLLAYNDMCDSFCESFWE